MTQDLEGSSGSAAAIDSSNIGFKLLKKHGWKEGTGLGISEQDLLGVGEGLLANQRGRLLWKIVVLAGLWAQWLERNRKIFEGAEEGLEEMWDRIRFWGRLEPVETYWKNNKRGLGVDKVKKKAPKPPDAKNITISSGKNEQELPSKKSKTHSKKMRKMQEFERQLQEKEFERAFFREFWPDNV
ncbi:G-patch domain containing protein [Parasponia andersonii]|uniref:G-patch domain containing protein n=1 Tax=Parasponia andersonii TaxID=3476 RepID=A0A2P5D4B5_PARAD|nr:G-patch domain containing protein [Parasponia andersonii]